MDGRRNGHGWRPHRCAQLVMPDLRSGNLPGSRRFAAVGSKAPSPPNGEESPLIHRSPIGTPATRSALAVGHGGRRHRPEARALAFVANQKRRRNRPDRECRSPERSRWLVLNARKWANAIPRAWVPTGPNRHDRDVAIGIVSSGHVGTIALRECDRRAAGAVRRSRTAEFGRMHKWRTRRRQRGRRRCSHAIAQASQVDRSGQKHKE
jgi:hypothetical protein